MILVPYRAEHIHMLEAQEAQKYIGKFMTDELAVALEATPALTGFVGERVIGCFGLQEKGLHMAVMWSIIDQSAGRHFLAIHRAMQAYLAMTPYRRIEIDVDCEFEQGHRWARMLGFTQECARRVAYRMDGGDSALYARLNNG